MMGSQSVAQTLRAVTPQTSAPLHDAAQDAVAAMRGAATLALALDMAPGEWSVEARADATWLLAAALRAAADALDAAPPA